MEISSIKWQELKLRSKENDVQTNSYTLLSIFKHGYFSRKFLKSVII